MQKFKLLRLGVVLSAAVVFALPGAAILFGGAASFLHGHIYWPSGGLAMVAVAGGCAALAWAAGTRPAPQPGGTAPVQVRRAVAAARKRLAKK